MPARSLWCVIFALCGASIAPVAAVPEKEEANRERRRVQGLCAAKSGTECVCDTYYFPDEPTGRTVPCKRERQGGF